MEETLLFHCHHGKKIRDQREDQVPYETTEDEISREVGSQECEESSINTESSISVKVHSYDKWDIRIRYEKKRESQPLLISWHITNYKLIL